MRFFTRLSGCHPRRRLRQRRQDRMAVAPVLGSRRAHLRRNFMDDKSNQPSLDPSDRFFSAKGILLGAYAIGGQADEVASRPLREQFDMSRAAVEGLHPGRSWELEKPMAVAW